MMAVCMVTKGGEEQKKRLQLGLVATAEPRVFGKPVLAGHTQDVGKVSHHGGLLGFGLCCHMTASAEQVAGAKAGDEQKLCNAGSEADFDWRRHHFSKWRAAG